MVYRSVPQERFFIRLGDAFRFTEDARATIYVAILKIPGYEEVVVTHSNSAIECLNQAREAIGFKYSHLVDLFLQTATNLRELGLENTEIETRVSNPKMLEDYERATQTYRREIKTFYRDGSWYFEKLEMHDFGDSTLASKILKESGFLEDEER